MCKPLVNSQRIFINELSDLLANRYIIRVQSYNDGYWLVKVQHLTNRRTLILRCTVDCGCIKENGRIIKSWPANSLDH